ncbi:unnamed protein product [Prunus brigantina]
MILSNIPLKESCWQCHLLILKREGKYQQVKERGLLLGGESEKKSNHEWKPIGLAANMVVEDEAWEPE